MKILLTTLTLLMMTSMAQAGFISLDEGATPQTGTISYDGLGGALIGNDILLTTATGGGGVPLNDGNTLSCVSCLLDFSTGLNLVEGPALWQWATGGAFALTGDLYEGINLLFSGVLVSGAFDAPNPIALGGGGAGSGALIVGVGSGLLAQDLADYFGIGTAMRFATTQLALNSCDPGAEVGSFYCALQDNDLAVEAAAAVDAPATALLFGIGAAGLVATRRKK
ncbi:MAG: hypothetical protein ACRCVD_03460 [Halioglobus sp.]